MGDVRACRWPDISIHALLAESDSQQRIEQSASNKFLSTLSLRRATRDLSIFPPPQVISIHALLAESDISVHTSYTSQQNFYPRSPCGERRQSLNLPSSPIDNFYPRSPCGERPAEHHANSQQEKFLSTLSLRRATERQPIGVLYH